MNEDHPYQSKWEKYRFWWKFYWLLTIPFAGFMLFWVLIDARSLHALTQRESWTEVVFITLLCILMPVVTVVSLKVQYWRCPRCDKWFNGSFFLVTIWTRKCRHCGLHKYEGSTYGPAK